MSRALLVPGAIIAVLACGTWVHATRTPASSAKAPAVHAPPADRIAPAIEDEQVVPQSLAKAPSPARARTRSTADTPDPEPSLSASMRIPADAGQSSEPALTIEEMQALARQEAEGLVTIRNADGSETLNHEDRFRDYTVLKVGADGQPVFVCVQGEAALKQVLRRATPTTKQNPPATAKGDR